MLSSEPEEEGQFSEQEYADTFHLSLRQMAWRRNKIIELRSGETFRQEYPATPAEAWTSSPEHEPFIKNLPVMRARKRIGVVGAGFFALVGCAWLRGREFS